MKRKLSILSLVLMFTSTLFAQYSQSDIESDLQYFTSSDCSELKHNVKKRKLSKFKSDLMRDIASQMLSGKYDREYRTTEYEAYPSSKELMHTIKLGRSFSQYENMTGIYLEKGQNVVFVGDTQGKEIALWVPNFMRKPAKGIKPTKDPNGWGLKKQIIKLKEGINIFDVEIASNAYIHYFDDNAAVAPKIMVHFPTGKINGYFDITKHDNSDWDKLLDNAVSPIMDMKGKHIQVAYPVEEFQEFTRSKGVELINAYDDILNHHYTLAGFVKYNKVPKNRMLARVNFNYYMFRDGDGVAYLGDKSTMKKVSDPAVVLKNCWGFCHEAGHALQIRPITWGGMTEVSVNIFSLYTYEKMGLKQNVSYDSSRKFFVDASPRPSYILGNISDKLVPLWQLHLYFIKHGLTDFYADLMEMMRNSDKAYKGIETVNYQFDFVKMCCDVSKTDLTDFFEQYGFFVKGEIFARDYTNYNYVITQKMVDDTKAYIASKNYPKPKEDITMLRE